MAEVGWELSDSENEEDIFERKLEAPPLKEEGEPGAAPCASSKVQSSSSGEGQPPVQRKEVVERPPGEKSPQKNGIGNGKLPYASPRNGRPSNGHSRFARRSDGDRHQDRFDVNEEENDGFDPSRYSMAFPKSPPFCAWFGNVTLNTDGRNLEDELYEYFAQLDLEPKEIRFGKSGASSTKTCCFVDFHDADDLRHVLMEVDNENAPRFYNCKLVVDIAEPRSTVSRFGGRGKRRGGGGGRRGGPISVGSDEYHSHVNHRTRRRGPDTPPRGGRGDFNRRRGSGPRGSDRTNGHIRSHNNHRNGGTPRRLSRNVSNGSSIHDDSDEMSYSRRDRDSFKVNGSSRDSYDRPPSVRSVRPSGPNRHRPRQDFDEPRHVRSPRRDRRAKPRENFNHSKRSSGSGGRAPKSRGGGRSKAPQGGNSRFSRMFG